MSGSQSKSDQANDGSSPNEAGRTSLADFLAPPHSRGSVLAPSSEENDAKAATPATTERNEKPLSVALESAARAVAPVTSTEAPSAAVAPRAAETASTAAPASNSDASARSLIPVATSSSDAPEDIDENYGVPRSGAAVRRATFVALLAAAAAVPAWVVFRARSGGVEQRTEAPTTKVSAASAGPTTVEPREIEADDDQTPEPAASAAVAVPIDPARGLELRNEARRLLEGGQIDQGVATARRAIEANPADPECYVLLAAGLQDQGRWAESREVFSRCVHKSNNVVNAECAYFATSGTITNR